MLQAVWRLAAAPTELFPPPPVALLLLSTPDVIFTFKICLKTMPLYRQFLLSLAESTTFPFSKPLHYSICPFTHTAYTSKAFITAPGF